MTSILAKIYQVSVLLYTTNNIPFRFPFKTAARLSSLLPVSFSDLELSNVLKLSRSDMPTATLADLDIPLEALDSFISLLLKVSIPAFSPPAHSFSLPSKSFIHSLIIVKLTNL